MTQELYAVHGPSESGDEYFFGIFNARPTLQHLIAMVQNTCPDELVLEEDGQLVSYVNPQVSGPFVVSVLPSPDEREVEFC